MKKRLRHTSIIDLNIISDNDHMFTFLWVYWNLLRAPLRDAYLWLGTPAVMLFVKYTQI